jgi:hypothetical protein
MKQVNSALASKTANEYEVILSIFSAVSKARITMLWSRVHTDFNIFRMNLQSISSVVPCISSPNIDDVFMFS